MKWIPIDKARKLEINRPCFIQYNKNEKDGSLTANIGYGNLIKEERTAKGIERTFEIAHFTGDAVETTTQVTHVAIP